MSSLKINNLNKVFPSGEAGLYNVSLEAEDKEFLVLAGGDDSGKSTLLRIIAGLEDATGGEVFIDGKDVTSVEPKDRDLAMIFKSSTLYPSLNVFDNIAFGLRLRKAPEALVRERVKVAAEVLGLADVLTRKPKTLTAAAKQRVAIGRAMVREPKLYLFDDPLSGLDEKLRLDVLNVIINLQARMNGTFVYCTKNVAEAMTIGTRIAVIKNGFLQQVDTPANLYDYPANTYVAFYIGSPTVNFVKKAVIGRTDGGYCAIFGGVSVKLSEKTVERFKNIDEYAGTDKPVILGIRPEDAKITADGVIKGVISGVSEDGKYAECDVTPDICLNVSVTGGAEKGKEVNISFDGDRLFVFDAKTCLTLLERDGGYVKTKYADADFVPLGYDEEEEILEGLKPKKEKKKK